jgi:NAD(P)H-hydrate repair Nnr-like enzyme with NAD(P)H-hydrate epimerase domain
MTTMRFVLPGGERVPAIDVAQMRAVDRSMIEGFHIELAQMMENAGRNLADLA